MSAPLLHTRWKIELPKEQEGPVADWLLESGASAVYQGVYPQACLYAYFCPERGLPCTEQLLAFSGVSLAAAETFADEDWLAKSRQGFGAIEVGRGLYVRPAWDEGPVPAGRAAIAINPGLAFGTGGHETTRLCMEMLECLADEDKLGGPLLDLGSGTGILALTAHLLGAEDIVALDVDPDCGQAMAELIEANRAAAEDGQPFLPIIGTLEDPAVNRKFNIIAANILLEAIQELLPLMRQRLFQGGFLIASGILAEKQDEALLSLAANGFKPIKMAQEGGWIAILARLETA